MDRPLRFVRRLDAVFRVLIETPVGCWLIDCNGPSPPFFAANLNRYERVPAPDGWMDDNQTTPPQEVRLSMIQPLIDCDDCISVKSLRYQMAADAAQQHQTTTRRILRLYYRYLATGRVTAKKHTTSGTNGDHHRSRPGIFWPTHGRTMQAVRPGSTDSATISPGSKGCQSTCCSNGISLCCGARESLRMMPRSDGPRTTGYKLCWILMILHGLSFTQSYI